MDADSRMDLDDAVAGHPVAMAELTALRSRLATLTGALERITKRLQQVDNCRYARQLPKCECHHHGIVVLREARSALSGEGDKVPDIAVPAATPTNPPESGGGEDFEECWLAERVLPNGNLAAEYLVSGSPGVPSHATKDPWKATRFKDRHACLMACTGTYNEMQVGKMIPVSHGFERAKCPVTKLPMEDCSCELGQSAEDHAIEGLIVTAMRSSEHPREGGRGK